MDIIMYQDNNSDPPSYQTKFALVRALCTNHYFTVLWQNWQNTSEHPDLKRSLLIQQNQIKNTSCKIWNQN